MRSKNKKLILASFVLILLFAIVMNSDVSIQQGVDGHYRRIHMPLYVKWIQFLARHYEYVRIAREITSGCKTDEEKVFAILKWTRKNIREIPPDMTMFDDHILNIIIRGYGSREDFNDVFTTLCAYSKITAFWEVSYSNNRKVKYPFSFVKLKEKWRVFDAYGGKYFYTKSGDLASVEDIINDMSILDRPDINSIAINGLPYKEFCNNLKFVIKPLTPRPQRQMPARRILFEVQKLIGIDND